MKIILAVIFSTAASPLFAQQNKILKLLNRELKKEVKHLRQNETYTWGDTRDSLIVVQPFFISKDNILSVEVTKKTNYGLQTTRQEVPLNKIETILEDINVLFVTAGKDVKVTTKTLYNDGSSPQTETYNYHLFFLNLWSGLQSESWRDAVAEAFSKAGLNIKNEIWED